MILAIGSFGFGPNSYAAMRGASPVLSVLTDGQLHHLEHQVTRIKNLAPFEDLRVNVQDVRAYVRRFAPHVASHPADQLVPFDELFDIPLWSNGFHMLSHVLSEQQALLTTEFALDFDEVNVFRRMLHNAP